MKRAFSKKNLWESTPTWLKSALGRALKSVPPAWLLGKSFRANRAFVQDAQWWPVERAREYQLARVRVMLALAYDKSVFYRRTFDAAGFHPRDLHSLDDLGGLPTMDKQTVLENLPDMCTRSINGKDVDAGNSRAAEIGSDPVRFFMFQGCKYAFF